MDISENNRPEWKLDDEGFHLFAPQRLRPWYNYLSNGEVGLKISHLGDGYSTTLREPRVVMTNYDFWTPLKGRFVYITDDGCVWNPSYHPSGTALDTYHCIHSPWATRWIAEKNGIQVDQTVFLPQEGTLEVLLVTVHNRSPKNRYLHVTAIQEFLLYNSFGVDPVYYSWFTDTLWDSERNILWLKKNVGAQVVGLYHTGTAPSSWQGSLRRLIGEGTPEIPQEIQSPPLSGSMSGGDPYIGAFQWFWELGPGESKTVAVVSGLAPLTKNSMAGGSFLTEIPTLLPAEFLQKIKHLGTPQGAQEELGRVRDLWQRRLFRDWYGSTGSGLFSSWLKTFFGAQVYQQSTGMVRSTFRGFRDVAQDVMGLCRFEPEKARRLLVDLCSHQYLSGRCVRQWNTEGGAPDERDFRDLPFWIPVALATYERICQDPSIWEEKAPYLDSSQPETLRHHAVRGIAYALQYGTHGLILMGAGDWNDALSGPGPHGGSTFLNMFAYWALSLLETSPGAQSGEPELYHRYSLSLKEHKQRLYEGVLRYWNGSWFDRAVVGPDSPTGAVAGTIVGTTNRDGADNRIFLLPQAWFTISGMAEQNPEIGSQALTSMLRELETEVGLLKCKPGYTNWDPAAGNLSSLSPGMAENFAVYNHAAAFAVYALFKAGRTEEALRIFRKILPFYKDWRKTRAEPYVLVNFYNGGYYPERAGEGGIPWLTGTANWIALCLWDYLLPLGVSVEKG